MRFATVLDYKIDAKTWDALVANAASIRQISAERIRDELVRIFLSPNRGRGWDLLDASGLMRTIFPEIEAMKGCEQPEQFHPEGDVFKHTRLMLDFLPEKVSLPLVFAVLLLWNPVAGAAAVIWLIAWYAIILGVLEIFFGFRLKTLRTV